MTGFDLLEKFDLVDIKYVEEAAAPVVYRRHGRALRRGAPVFVAAAVLAACAVTAFAGADLRELVTGWVSGALPGGISEQVREQLELGQWAYLEGDSVAVIIPDSPVRIMLSDDGGGTWRETTVTGSDSVDFFGEECEVQYCGGYIGLHPDGTGYLVLTTGAAMGFQQLRVFLTGDGGGTWDETGSPFPEHISVVTGAGFASNDVGFICYRYAVDSGPDIWRTLDGGGTWARLEVELPEGFNYTPLSPAFDGTAGVLPVTARPLDGGEETTLYLRTADQGLTWTVDG